MNVLSWTRRTAGLAILLAVLVGGFTGRVAAEPVYGGTHENESYGFAFAFDEAIWTIDAFASDAADGVNLGTVNSFGMIWGIEVPDGSDDCFDAMLESLESDESGDFEIAPDSFARPEPGAGLQGELVLARFTDDTGTYETLFYVACRPLAGGNAVLNVMMAVSAVSYEPELATWQELLGSIEVDDAEPDESVRLDIELGVTRE